MKFASGRPRLDQLLPIYSPRTSLKLSIDSQSHLLSNLALNIDRYTIDKIKQEFESHQNQLSLIDFVVILKGHLGNWQPDLPNREIKLTRCLLQLYKELDGGRSSGTIHWQRFTNYIISKVTQLKSTKIDQIRPYTRSPVVLKEKFMSLLHKVIYIEELDRLAFFEEGGDRVYLMNHETGQLGLKPLIVQPKKLTVETSSIKKERDGKLTIKKKNMVIPTDTIILDIFYITDPKYRVLLTSTNDGVIRGWKFQGTSYVLAPQPENEEDFIFHQFVNEIYCMAWDSLNEVLYCSDKEGSITTWNLKTDIEKPLSDGAANDGHTLIVMSMVTMPKLQFMASGGMDGKLILWDTINNRKKWIYKEHARGIMTLAFNQALILLFSAGFDHQICIWNPYISNVIHKMQAHPCPIYALKIIEGTNQLLSMDSEGSVKITDVRRFNVINSFTVDSSDEKIKMEPMSLAVIPKPLKIAISGHTIRQFEYDKNYVPAAVDDCMAICCKCVPSLLSLYTPVGAKIKVWSLLTGEVDKIFTDITKGEITAFCLNLKESDAFIGDSLGNIRLIDVKNGGFEKELPKHNGEVSFILAVKAMKIDELIITAGTDNQIRLMKENDAGRYDILRTIYIKKEVSVSCLAYSDRAKTVIVGTNFGVIGFYEMETGKLMGSTSTSSVETSVTSINLVTDLPYIIETNNSGRISVVATPPHQLRFSRVFSVLQPDSESPYDTSKITSSIFRKNKLYVADDKGFVKCYNFSLVLEELAALYNRPDENTRIGMTEINYFWSVRAHNESIKTLDFIANQSLLVTSSYDKRVKLWSADSGAFVDQLEQNFMKEEPQPIAYQKLDTVEVYAPNFKDQLSLKNVDQPTVLAAEFNPRWLFDRIDTSKLASNGISNRSWKVNPMFEGYNKKQFAEFQDIDGQVKKIEDNMKQIHLGTTRPKRDLSVHNILSTLNKSKGKEQGEQSPHKTPSQSAADNIRQIRDKEFNARRKFMEDIKHLILKKNSLTEDVRTKAHRQREYSDSLHKKESIGKLCYKDDKIIRLSQEEATAAYNLSAALSNIDHKDIRALKFVNNVVVKEESSRSRHNRSYSQVRLPRI